jgi:hypothetical protein
MCYGKEERGMRLQNWKLEAQECSGNLRAKIDENIWYLKNRFYEKVTQKRSIVGIM